MPLTSPLLANLVPVEGTQPGITAAFGGQGRFPKHIDKLRILTPNPSMEPSSSWRFTQSSLLMDVHGFGIAERVLLLCKALYGPDEERDSPCPTELLIFWRSA